MVRDGELDAAVARADGNVQLGAALWPANLRWFKQIGGQKHWNVYTRSSLQFGINSARRRHFQTLTRAAIDAIRTRNASYLDENVLYSVANQKDTGGTFVEEDDHNACHDSRTTSLCHFYLALSSIELILLLVYLYHTTGLGSFTCGLYHLYRGRMPYAPQFAPKPVIAPCSGQ